ncbi:CAAX amino terminal protease family [Synechococcus sp. PCC 7502]|uniref:CPBP family intramembrane glutamic endopeptidase n=1 Tax=Synechococcus sp. PCC 7502 TaxID=1173263 RepID=UPI00029FCA8D|nr:type II CAAX endopeptidase family protein [Synechococcus sp. PCC 7502]AFY72629.1 CAAX amino terminal protease family [Synechococcus sp. PCC 7502]
MAKYPFLLRLGAFLGILLGLWLPIALPVYLIFKEASSVSLGILLYILFVGLIWVWGRKVEGVGRPYYYYGLGRHPEGNHYFFLELLAGFGVGFMALFLLMELQVSWGWLSWQPNIDWISAIGSGVLTGLGVGFAEELLFRGLLLTEMEKDFGTGRSLWLNSSFFAITHFIKSEPIQVLISRLVQFPGLMLLGMTLVWARRSQNGSLGLAIGLHGGLVGAFYIVNTTSWIRANQVVPEWITGIGGNPLAGIMGLLFLGAIALGIRLKPKS